MAFSLYTLLEAGLLFVNAIAILNRQRFLSKVGLSQPTYDSYGDNQPGVKSQIVNLIYAVQTVMRVPLIFLNIVVIVIKLLLG